MAKSMYIGIDNKARKVKKMYTGIDNKARKVKKGYVGVGGIARPFFSIDQKLVYNGTLPDWEQPNSASSCASNNNYLIYAGGITNITYAYNSQLVRKKLAGLSNAKTWLAGASNPKYAFFAGGFNSPKFYGEVDAFDNNLVCVSAQNLLEKKDRIAGASFLNHVVFAGGTGSGIYSTVETYDENLTKNKISNLSQSCYWNGAGVINNNLIFAGGETGKNWLDNVEIYNQNFVHSVGSSLFQPTSRMTAGQNDNFLVFHGLSVDSYHSISSEAYNKQLVHQKTADFPKTMSTNGSASLGEYIIFSGGSRNNATYSFDDNLTLKIERNISITRDLLELGGTIGDYAIFCAGYSLPQKSKTKKVDSFKLV